jgi:hypothetical protein
MVSAPVSHDLSKAPVDQSWDFLAPELAKRGYGGLERFSLRSSQLYALYASHVVSEERSAPRIRARLFLVDLVDPGKSTIHCLAIRVKNCAAGSIGVYGAKDVASERDPHVFELPEDEVPEWLQSRYIDIPNQSEVFACREFYNLYQLRATSDDGDLNIIDPDDPSAAEATSDDGDLNTVQINGPECFLPPKLTITRKEAGDQILSIIDAKFHVKY